MPAPNQLLNQDFSQCAYQKISSVCKRTITKALISLNTPFIFTTDAKGKKAAKPPDLPPLEAYTNLCLPTWWPQKPPGRHLDPGYCSAQVHPAHTHTALSKQNNHKNQIFSFPSYSTSSPNQEEPPLMLHRFNFAPCRVSAHPPNTCIRHTPQFNKHMNACFTLNTEVQSALHRLKDSAGSKHECSADGSFCKAPPGIKREVIIGKIFNLGIFNTSPQFVIPKTGSLSTINCAKNGLLCHKSACQYMQWKLKRKGLVRRPCLHADSWNSTGEDEQAHSWQSIWSREAELQQVFCLAHERGSLQN